MRDQKHVVRIGIRWRELSDSVRAAPREGRKSTRAQWRPVVLVKQWAKPESTDPDEMHGVRWDGYRVDVVFDTVGGERLRRSPAVLRAGGRIVSVAEEPPDGGVYFIVAANHDQLRSEALAAGVRDKPETAIGTMLTEHSRSDRARLRQT